MEHYYLQEEWDARARRSVVSCVITGLSCEGGDCRRCAFAAAGAAKGVSKGRGGTGRKVVDGW